MTKNNEKINEILMSEKNKSTKSCVLTTKSINFVNDTMIFGVEDFSTKVNEIITEYNSMLKASLKELDNIDNKFTEEEMNTLRDICNCMLMTSESTRLISPALALHGELVDYCQLNEIETPKELEEKLLKLTYAQSLALFRSIQAWWHDQKLI